MARPQIPEPLACCCSDGPLAWSKGTCCVGVNPEAALINSWETEGSECPPWLVAVWSLHFMRATEGHGGPRRKGPFTGQWRAWCMLLKMDPWASDKGAGEDKTHCVLGGCGWRGGEEKSIPSSVATSSGRVRTSGWKLREREGNPVGSHLWSFLCVRHWSMNFHTHHLVGSYKTVKFLNNL